MNFFQAQLKYFFGSRPEFENAKYVGRACFVLFPDGTKIKAEFITQGIHERYEALKLTTMNTTEGVIDSTVLKFDDYFNKIPRGNLSSITPHMWVSDGKPEWYCSPTFSDKESLADAVCEYVGVFSPEETISENMAMFM